MLLKIYCVKDNLKGQLDNVYLSQNDAQALRTIGNWINDKSTGLLYTNTADFSVWSLGVLDTDTGIITSSVEFVMNCIDLKSIGD